MTLLFHSNRNKCNIARSTLSFETRFQSSNCWKFYRGNSLFFFKKNYFIPFKLAFLCFAIFSLLLVSLLLQSVKRCDEFKPDWTVTLYILSSVCYNDQLFKQALQLIQFLQYVLMCAEYIHPLFSNVSFWPFRIWKLIRIGLTIPFSFSLFELLILFYILRIF
jgi:hypothetical protein